MKKAWSDLKSFITISMIIILAIIVIANLFGYVLQDNILILVTNLITAVFTYYFTKRDDNTKIDENSEKSSNDNILPDE